MRAISRFPSRPGNRPRGNSKAEKVILWFVEHHGLDALLRLIAKDKRTPAQAPTHPPSARKSNRPPMSAAKRAALSAAMKMK